MTGETTQQILASLKVDPAKCASTSCQMETAQNLTAEKFVSGTVQYTDGEFVASIRATNTEDGRVLAAETLTGKTMKALRQHVDKVGKDFFQRSGMCGGSKPAVETVEKKETAPAKKGTGSLKVTTEPSGALVRVDGDEVGKTPWKKKLESGNYVVSLEKAGYAAISREIDVEAGKEAVVAETLEEVRTGPGKLLITVNVDSECEAAGKRVNATVSAVAVLAVDPGSTTVTCRRDGYTPGTSTVDVPAAKGVPVRVSLEKILGPVAGQVSVEPKSGLEFAWLPGGTFHFGCEPGDTECYDHEKPGRTVTVAPMKMARTEVTVSAYRKCVDSGACTVPNSDRAPCNWGKSGRENHPVNCVDHAQATSFCRWIGGRLPTAEEWEFAAKGGQSRVYPWGRVSVIRCTGSSSG